MPLLSAATAGDLHMSTDVSVGPRPLRVLLATARYFPYSGGIETHVFEVARRLAAEGVDVTVLTTDPSARLPAYEDAEGVTVRRVRSWPRNVEDYYVAPGIYREIVQGSWDVVHCQGSHTFVPALVMFAALRAGIPYVVTFHTGTHSSSVRNALRGLQWAVLRPLFVRAARFVAVSGFEEQFFTKSLGVSRDRFVRIPNGSDLPAPPPGTTTDSSLILSVGRLERFKGHHRVIEALPEIRRAIPTARLLILGTGPYKSALESLAESLGVADAVEIRSIPAGDRERMSAVMAQSGLVTLLSEGESHPVAIMEALALRRSVLVARSPGLQELADRGLVRGISLTTPSNGVATEIVRLLRDPMTPTLTDLPTWDQCAQDLLAVYRDVARRRVCAS